ncbi:MAG: phospholipase D-like domain-containing protein [Pseudomonadota bacterium]|jgi:phosphatidylserine/phosphatidylglycerophosphate/cardiolipin synthase-like enzyme|nr:phospholipase D-like domain-containing protein [Pseudomonadota bacterium]|tara:strand:- start:4002 stop:5456 length:1455 start_codon:yes stop_codon:yes gene_type:complete
MTSILSEGESCWRVARADRFSVIIDAADFFRLAKQSMLKAKRSIYMIGWDFDTRIRLEPDNENAQKPDKLGRFLNSLAKDNADLDIRILKWDIGLIASITRGETPFYLLRWIFNKRIHLKLDGAHPSLAAHHMKLLVIDDQVAFCGGIDMTICRWDTREHLEYHPARRSPRGKEEAPWHDATSCCSGPAAAALAELARNRWQMATEEKLEPQTVDSDAWPDDLAVEYREIDVGIARTAPEYQDRKQIAEIETATLAIIAAAKESLYIESQYFASRRIARAIAKRLEEPDGPEIVIINPETADGWLEAKTMDSARILMMKLVREADRHDRFRIFYPVNEAETSIYVHAKLMIADDRILKIGSANLNNRSMGYDTECDVIIEAGEDQAELRQSILRERQGLLAEHLARTPEEIEEALRATNGSLIGLIDRLNRDHGRGLRPIEMRELTADEEMVAESDVTDPERPAGVDYSPSHFLRRKFRRKAVV